MNRTLNHPWNELDRAWNMFDQVFRNPIGTGASSRGKFPKVQTWSRGDHYAVTAELPGVELDAVNVSAQDNILTISGELTQPPTADGVYHRNERAYGKFHRELRLPISVDGSKTTAQLKNGVLTVTICPVEADQPKKIKVTA